MWFALGGDASLVIGVVAVRVVTLDWTGEKGIRSNSVGYTVIILDKKHHILKDKKSGSTLET